MLRILLYLVQTWHKYIKREKLDIYGEKKIELPKPELYVIYTKPDAGKKPDNLTLKDTLFDGEDICIDCKVRVIKDGKKGDIISQYVRFCRVFDEQVRIYGRTLKAVEETIRICKDEKVLKEYLERQREEVIDIMMTLFDQETIMRNHDLSLVRNTERRMFVETAQQFGQTLADTTKAFISRFHVDKEVAEKDIKEYWKK